MKNFFKKLSFVLAIAMVLTSLAPATASAAAKNYITDSRTGKKVTSIYVYVGGAEATLTPYVNGKKASKAIVESSNPERATIDKTGKITPVANGNTTITFTQGKTKIGSVTVKVRTRAKALNIYDRAEYAAGKKEKLSEVTLKVGEKKDLQITMPISKAAKKVVKKSTYFTYAEYDSSVVKVNKLGNGQRHFEVEAVAAGTTKVTIVANQKTEKNVRADKYYKEASFDVTVKDEKLEAKQSGYNTIKVTGTDLSDKAADYTVKRGTAAVTLSDVVLNETKTEATLVSAASKLAKGDYTLKFGELEAAFTAEDEQITSVVIDGTNLVLADGQTGAAGNTATIGYKILNQWEERMTGNVNATCSLGTANVTTQASRTADGVITVTLGMVCYPEVTEGTLIVVDTTLGKSASETVKLSSPRKIASAEILGVYDVSKTYAVKADLKSGAIGANKYALLVDAKDQYGKSFSTFNSAAGGNVTLTVAGATNLAVTNGTFGTVQTSETSAPYICVPFDAATLVAGSTLVTLVGNSVGLLDTYTVEVAQATVLATLEVAPLDTYYVGTKGEVSFTALDTEGNTVTDYNTLSKIGATEFNGNTDFTWERQADGSAKLFLTPTVGQTITTAITSNTTKTAWTQALVMTKINNTGIKTAMFTINEAKIPVQIIGVNGGSLAALKGGVGALNVKAGYLRILDQYGNELSAAEAVDLLDTLNIDVLREVNDTKGVFTSLNTTTITGISGNVLTDATTVILNQSTSASTTGAVQVKLALVDNGVVVPNSECVIKVSSVDIEDVTDFAIKALDKQLDASVDDAVTNQAITVTGKVGGVTVTIPGSDYTIIPTAHTVVAGSGVSQVLKTKELPAGTDGRNDTATESLEVVIGNSKGTSVKMDIEVSNVPGYVKSAKAPAAGLALTGANKKTANGTVVYATDLATQMTVKDQYGVANATAPRLNYTNLPTGVTVAHNNTKEATLTVGAAGTYTAGTYAINVTLVYSADVTVETVLVLELN